MFPRTRALDLRPHPRVHLPLALTAAEPLLLDYTDRHLPSRDHPPISPRHRIGLVPHPTKLGLRNLHRGHQDPVLLLLEIIHHLNPGSKRDPLLPSIVSIG